MSAVSFYRLKSPQPHGKMRLVCQLAATAYRKGHKIYISAVDEAQCEMLYQMLWTFAPNSFIPHTTLMDNSDPDIEKFPVVIGYKDPPKKFNDVLISLQPEVPSYVDRFQRIVEPVDVDTQEQEQADSRFGQYESLLKVTPKTYHM